MTEYTPKPGEKCITSCGTAEAVLITPIQWVLKDLQDDHLFIVDQSDFDSVKPAPTARDEALKDLKRVWLDGLPPLLTREASIGFERIYDAGYRKLPSRTSIEAALVDAWGTGKFGANTATSKAGEVLRTTRDIILDLIYGEDNV